MLRQGPGRPLPSGFTAGTSQERDEAFRAHSDSANARIMYFSLFQVRQRGGLSDLRFPLSPAASPQMAVVLASAWWQISHLKSFFIKKKLI